MEDHQGFLMTTDIPESFKMTANNTNVPLDCTWVLYAPAGHRVGWHKDKNVLQLLPISAHNQIPPIAFSKLTTFLN